MKDKPFTVVVEELGGWWSAVCPELNVSGFGPSKEQALDAVSISMHSTLEVYSDIVQSDMQQIVEVICNTYS